jgi:hypothetical protein
MFHFWGNSIFHFWGKRPKITLQLQSSEPAEPGVTSGYSAQGTNGNMFKWRYFKSFGGGTKKKCGSDFWD